jgi:ABC-type nitrate/sulfonate/bicarbonate transport system permease component
VTRILVRVVAAVALPVLLLAAWWFGSADSRNYYEPPLRKIFQAFPGTWTPERLTGDVLPSVLRLLVGYALALVVGVGLGVVIGASRPVRQVLEPSLEFLRAVPPPVLVPVLILIAGISDHTKVLVILVGACVRPGPGREARHLNSYTAN